MGRMGRSIVAAVRKNGGYAGVESDRGTWRRGQVQGDLHALHDVGQLPHLVRRGGPAEASGHALREEDRSGVPSSQSG